MVLLRKHHIGRLMTDTDRYKCNIATLSSEDLFEHRKGKRRRDGGERERRSEIGENR